jgi:hypothetical protein
MEDYSQQQKQVMTKKIVNIVNNSQLDISQDFEILDAILAKYCFQTISNYSISSGKSRQGLYKKVGRDDFPHYVIDGVPFVISNLF